jgi:hypothetical protein
MENIITQITYLYPLVWHKRENIKLEQFVISNKRYFYSLNMAHHSTCRTFRFCKKKFKILLIFTGKEHSKARGVQRQVRVSNLRDLNLKSFE